MKRTVIKKSTEIKHRSIVRYRGSWWRISGGIIIDVKSDTVRFWAVNVDTAVRLHISEPLATRWETL